MSSDGKVAIVTGGARGIGRACALRLAKAGFAIAVVDLLAAEASETVKQVRALGPDAMTFEADVSSLDAALAGAEAIRHALGRIDVLINNAAIRGPTAPVVAYPPPDWEVVLRDNLTGPILCSQAFAPGMQRKGW